MQLSTYTNSQSYSLSPAKLWYDRCVGNSSKVLLNKIDDRDTAVAKFDGCNGAVRLLRVDRDPHLLRDHKSR